MNVVFLVLTTAVGAGPQTATTAVAGPYTPPAVTSSDSGCCGATSSCCDKPGLLDRLRAKFRKGGDCCDSAPATTSCCSKPPKEKVCGGQGSGCFGSGGGGLLARFGKKGDKGDAGCCGATSAATCDPCAGKERAGLFDRLRAKFRKGDGCCDAPATTGCCGSGATGAVSGTVIHSGTTTGKAIIQGTIPQGTYVTTPIITQPKTGAAAPNGTPINAQPSEPRQKLPTIDGKGKGIEAPLPTSPKPTVTTTPVLTPTAGTVETETKRPFDLGRRQSLRGDRAAEFSQLTGRLTFVHADGGRWVLRYAPLSEADGNGGAIQMENDRRMASYRDGDVVAVEGRIVAPRGRSRLGAPVYQAQSIRLVERPN